MLYLVDMQPRHCPKCGKPMEPRLHGWEAQDDFYNAKRPFLCDCGARYLIKEAVVANAFDQADTVGGDAGYDRAAKVNLLSELYVILGALDAPEAVLDQVLAAVEGDVLPYPSLLPFENR
ncbi:Uncharacterised protein [Pseudomonas aeruginosa]|uniref:hypothetical protein n=1 Tax=Pseudomonas aeruginosa TaxID=287 RepID=UPI0007179B78|nr:hypothetical protein [Pseudomonas aeruginosa]KRV02458.1 hypothetical protein AN455_11070 [Pseudomonas aeruginosa]KRV08265.1 hypothetical protein AN456_11900 [Pseudomonas aeruginosa]SQC54711.1 Uncharacterised protein [Pseudomonas aeruginosa]